MDLGSMQLAILILAKDLASPIFNAMGASGIASMGMLSTAALALGAAVAGIGVASIAAAVPYDQALHKIAATTDTNAQQLAYYNQQILALGPSMDMSASSMASALWSIISAGLDPLSSAMDQAKNNIDVLKYSAMAATANMGDQKVIADALTSVMLAYADSGLTAGNAMDVLQQIVSRGKADFSAFTSTLGIGATTAQAAGVSFIEFSAAMATLTGPVGNSGVRRMSNDLQNLMRSMMSIDDVSKRTDAQLKAMGISDAATFTTINQAATDAGESFNAMSYASMSFLDRLKYLAQLSGFKDYNSQRMQAIQTQASQIEATQGEAAAQSFLNYQLDEGSAKFEKVVGGAAAFLPALVLLQQGGASYSANLAAMTEKTQDFGTKTAAAYNTMRQSTGQQLNMLGLSVQNIGVVIGLQLLPYVNQVLTAFRGIALAIVGWLAAPGRFDQVTTAVKGLAIIVAGPLLMAILSAAAAALPFTMALLGVMAASYLVGNAFNAISSHWSSVQQFLRDASPLALALKVALGMLAAYVVGELAVAFGIWAVGAWNAAIATIAATWPILLLIAAVFAVIFAITLLVTHWNLVVSVLGKVAGAVGAFFGGMFSAIGTFMHGIVSAIGEGIGGLFSWLGSLGSTIGTALANAFAAAGSFVITAIQDLVYFIVGAFVLLYKSSPWMQAVVGALRDAFNAARIFVGTAMSMLGSFIYERVVFIGTVFSMIGTILNTYVVQPFQRLAGLVGGALGATFSTIGLFLSSVLSAIGIWISQTWRQFTDWLNGIANTVKNLGGLALGAVNDAIIKPVTNAISIFVQQAESMAGNFIKNFVKGITDGASAVSQGFQTIINAGKHALEGHSPPPGWPEQATYGQVLVKNFVAGIQTSLPQVTLAMGSLQGAAASGLQSSLPRTAMVGGGGNTTVNITANFPSVTDSDQIQQAFNQMIAQRERTTYQKGRQPGRMQGPITGR